MAKTGIELQGTAKLLRKLNRIAPKVSRDAQRKALREASTPILKTAKRLVPVDEGDLKKSLGRKFKAYKRDDVVVVIIGPRIKLGKYAGQAGHLVEFGTVPRYRDVKAVRESGLGKKGKGILRVIAGRGGYTGKMWGRQPPRPFMRPAWDLHKIEARATIRRRLQHELEKAMSEK